MEARLDLSKTLFSQKEKKSLTSKKLGRHLRSEESRRKSARRRCLIPFGNGRKSHKSWRGRGKEVREPTKSLSFARRKAKASNNGTSRGSTWGTRVCRCANRVAEKKRPKARLFPILKTREGGTSTPPHCGTSITLPTGPRRIEGPVKKESQTFFLSSVKIQSKELVPESALGPYREKVRTAPPPLKGRKMRSAPK